MPSKSNQKTSTVISINAEEAGLTKINALESLSVIPVITFLTAYEQMRVTMSTASTDTQNTLLNLKGQHLISSKIMAEIVMHLEDARFNNNAQAAASVDGYTNQPNEITVSNITNEKIYEYLKSIKNSSSAITFTNNKVNDGCRKELAAIRLSLDGQFKSNIVSYACSFKTIFENHGKPADVEPELVLFFWKNLQFKLRRGIIVNKLLDESFINEEKLKLLLSNIDEARRFVAQLLHDHFDKCMQLGVKTPWKFMCIDELT